MPEGDQLGAALAAKRDRILLLPPAVQERFADLIWRRTVGPKQAANFTSKEDADAARKSFVNSFLKRGATQLPQDYGKEPVKHSLTEKAGATVAAAGAGVAGGLKNVADVMGDSKLTPPGKKNVFNKVSEILNKYIEAPAYSYAQEVAPDAAPYAAGAGKAIPSILAAEAVGGGIPIPSEAGALAKTGLRAVRGAAQGAAGMVPFSTDPSEIGKGAGYGAVLEPLIGPLLSGKRAKPSIGEAPKVAASSTASRSGNISETVAQRTFGKSVSELSPSEMADHAKAVQAELHAQREAEQAAAKAAKPARTPKVKVAKAAATPKAPKQTAAQAQAVAQAQVQARAAGSPTGPGANASTTVSQTAAPPASVPVVNATGTPEPGGTVVKELELKNQAEAARLAQAKIDNIAAAASAQTPEVRAATGAMKDFAGAPPATTKVPEGEHGKRVRAKPGQPASPAQQAVDRERKAAARAKAAGSQPSSELTTDTSGEIGKKWTGARVSVQDTPTVEIEQDFKQLSPEAYKIIQGLKVKQKWDDAVYRGYLIDWFTKALEHAPKKGG